MRTAVQRRRLLVCPCCPGKYKALVEPMSDITTHYGGSIMAMAGKGCVAIIADHRLGNGFIMVSKRFRRVFPLTPRTYVGFGGFTPDAQHLLDKLKTRVQLFRLDEGRDIEPDELANLISYMLYAHRASPLYVSPIVAGLRADGTPYVCGMDCLGSKTEPGTFVVGGTAEHNLAGMCEALYAENMDADRLFTATGQAFLNAVGRDALSGWGAECIVITPERRIERELKGRCD